MLSLTLKRVTIVVVLHSVSLHMKMTLNDTTNLCHFPEVLHACLSFFQFESVQPVLESLEAQRASLRPLLASLEQEVDRLKEWASGLTDKRTLLQSSLTQLGGAVGQIEERTSAITKDLTNKVHHFCYHSYFLKVT